MASPPTSKKVKAKTKSIKLQDNEVTRKTMEQNSKEQVKANDQKKIETPSVSAKTKVTTGTNKKKKKKKTPKTTRKVATCNLTSQASCKRFGKISAKPYENMDGISWAESIKRNPLCLMFVDNDVMEGVIKNVVKE